MPARTPEERALIARIAKASQKAKYPDQRIVTEAARRARRAKWEATALELHPDADSATIAVVADELMRAEMLRMSLKAAQGRRRAREFTAIADAAEAALRAGGDAA
jgi:hypothetical protein